MCNKRHLLLLKTVNNPKGTPMKVNLFHSMLCMFVLILFTTSPDAQWTKTNWPASNSFFDLSTSGSNVFARTWDSLNGGRTFLSSDNGENWIEISSADSSIGILSMMMINNDIFAGTWDGLYRSASGGTSWNIVSQTGIPANTDIWSVALINGALFAGSMGTIFKSADKGTTWTEVKSGIPATARIRSIVSSGNTIFSISDTSGVFMSTNGGTSWVAINSGLTDKHIFQFAVLGTKLLAVTMKGVFTSGNNGTNWVSNDVNLKNVNCLLVTNNQIFAGTDSSGVYFSDDSGTTWNPFNSGLPAGIRIWSLTANSNNIFAGTGSGIWRTAHSAISIKMSRLSENVALKGLKFRMQNSFRATVKFALSTPGMVALEVYDLCGNQILSREYKSFNAGVNNISFNTGAIASGSYILRLTSGVTARQLTVTIQR